MKRANGLQPISIGISQHWIIDLLTLNGISYLIFFYFWLTPTLQSFVSHAMWISISWDRTLLFMPGGQKFHKLFFQTCSLSVFIPLQTRSATSVIEVFGLHGIC